MYENYNMRLKLNKTTNKTPNYKNQDSNNKQQKKQYETTIKRYII